MRPGATIPSDVPIEEGFTILLVEGVVTIVGSLNDLRPKQISAARSAAVRIGLAKATNGLIVLGLTIYGLTDGWEGIPFSLSSDEHTSELQSLMRHQYAVFCLKKKH